eukprot:scaffold7.g3505.t1
MTTSEGGLSSLDRLQLSLRAALYQASRTLGLDRLKDWMQGASLTLDAAVWLMGECYSGHSSADSAEQEEALAQLLLHFQSILWMTYREGFTPIPTAGSSADGAPAAGQGGTAAAASSLRTDCGWGCTLRSGQMVLGAGLARHWLGRAWRWPTEQPTEPPPALAALLQLFWDAPSHRNPFSLHNLCAAGRRCGVQPGRWLGPWVMCKALEAAAAAAAQHQDLGCHVAVLAEAGGGAPQLYTRVFEEQLLGPAARAADGEQEGWELLAERQAAAAAEAAVRRDSEQQWAGEQQQRGGGVAAVGAPSGAGGGGPDSSANGGGSGKGLILLVPLTLGLDKINPVYLPQLRAVLALPQSIGIVGGLPGRSRYVVGCQGDSLLFLDPHQVQQAASCDGDWQSFHCSVLRTMPAASLDPSLALGFYCSDWGEFQDLCRRLAELEQQSRGAPLVCVTTHPAAPPGYDGGAASWEPDELSDEEEDEEEEEEEEEGEGERVERCGDEGARQHGGEAADEAAPSPRQEWQAVGRGGEVAAVADAEPPAEPGGGPGGGSGQQRHEAPRSPLTTQRSQSRGWEIV